MDMNWKPQEFTYQCQECNKIYSGPSDGVNPGFQTHHISHPEGGDPVYLATPDADHPGNVSHGICGPECEANWKVRWLGEYEEAKRLREQERREAEAEEKRQKAEEKKRKQAERRKQQRFKRGRRE